jgi:hypothetical protein
MRSVSFAALLLAALLLPFGASFASDRDGSKRATIAYDSDSDSDSDRRHGKRKQRDHRDRRDYRDYRDYRDHRDSDRYRDRHSDWDSDSDRRRARRNWVGWRWWGW